MARTASDTYKHDWNDDSWTTGTPTTAAETLSGTTESKTGGIDCSAYWGVQVTVDINYDTTPTDDVIINLYGSTDNSNFDNTPLDFVVGDNATDPEQLTIMMWNPPKYLQVGFVQNGSTDSHEISTVELIGFN